MLGLMQDWPLTVDKILEHAGDWHGGREVRNVAVREDHPFDVSWITSLAGYELHRFRYLGTERFWRRNQPQQHQQLSL
jgi:hypothetical protein